MAKAKQDRKVLFAVVFSLYEMIVRHTAVFFSKKKYIWSFSSSHSLYLHWVMFFFSVLSHPPPCSQFFNVHWHRITRKKGCPANRSQLRLMDNVFTSLQLRHVVNKFFSWIQIWSSLTCRNILKNYFNNQTIFAPYIKALWKKLSQWTAHSPSFLFWKGHLPQIVSYLIIQRFENYEKDNISFV